MQDAIETLRLLDKQFEVFIVSAAIEFGGSLVEKHEWLQEHFSFISWRKDRFCGSKKIIKGDVMTGDHFKNLGNFEGQTILFTQPHTDGHNDSGPTSVEKWRQ